MANLVHKQFFSGGMDKDIHPKNIEQGNYLYALNMRNGKTDSENFGAMTNTRGNVLIPYELPQGHNKCIGTLEDKQSERIIWFVWNSLNEHSILAYRQKTNDIVKVLQGEYLGFQEDMLITDPSIIDGHLVQWRETKLNGLEVSGNPLRYIDVNRAILSDKKVKFDIIVANDEFNAKTSSYSVKLTIGGTDIIQPLIQGHENAPNEPNSKADLYKRLKDVLNAEFSHLLVADDCGGCRLEVEFLIEGDCWIEITSDKDDFMSLPQNRYHKDIDSTTISLGRLVPFREPKVQLVTDPDFKFNYVSDNFFQFATRYVYFDGQKSTFSDFSVIANTSHAQREILEENAIEIDFSDPIFKIGKRLADIKRVEIGVRNGNHGSFNIVSKIDVCDISYPNQKLIFRNDGQYSAVSDTDAYMGFSQIPLLSTAHTVVDDRSWYGGTLERYDNLDCVDAKVELESRSSTCGETVTIRGRVVITGHDQIQGDPQTAIYQPIYKRKKGGVPQFGGITRLGLGGNHMDDAEKKAKQQIPLKGFTAYLAGTDFYATTKPERIFQSREAIIRYDDDNIPIIENSNDVEQMQIALFRTGEGFGHQLQNQGGMFGYSYEIKNVPKGGKYILRLASHRISDTDDIGNSYNISRGLDWQKTSTYTGGSRSEYVIETDGVGEHGVVTAPDFFVKDLSFFDRVVSGHLVTGGVIGSSLATMDTMEYFPINLNEDSTKNWSYTQSFVTDHNGFWHYAGKKTKLPISSIMDVYSDNDQVIKGNLFEVKDKTPYDMEKGKDLSLSSSTLTEVVIVSSKSGINNYRATIKGRVVHKETGVPLKGSIVTVSKKNDKSDPTIYNPIINFRLANSTGRFATTDSNGEFEIRIYISGFNDLSGFDKIQEFVGMIMIAQTEPCKIIYEDLVYEFTLKSNVNNTVYGIRSAIIHESKDFEFTYGDYISGKWKRRNSLKLGIIYQDEYNRQSKVQTSDDLDVYIPFWTESEDKDSTPSIKWTINHKPPKWATKYQIVRTLNSIYSNYQQFVIGTPKYVSGYNSDGSVNETTYEARDAQEVYIPLETLALYTDENWGNVVSWEIGYNDRVTLMKKEDGSWYDGFYDYLVKNTKTKELDDVTYLVIDFDLQQPKIGAGATIEVYSTLKEPQLDLFYMIGQTYPIKNGMHLGGEDGQDQTSLQPATGYLYGGDTYIQRRGMSFMDKTVKRRMSENYESQFMDELLPESRVQDIGRLVSADNDYKQNFYYTRVRHTGRYLPDTNVNLLNIFTELGYFQDENKTEIDRQFGVLMSLAYTGGSVLAILQFKCVPIYTNATPVFDLSGEQSILTKSRSIANIAQPFVEDKGTQNPESVLVQNGRVFAWDGLRGVFWRYASNGQFNISDYGMINEFYEVSKQLKGIEAKVVTGYDRKNRQMIVSFTDLNKTISFDERLSGDTYKNTWSSEWTYIPDMFVTLGEQMFSFKNGSLYKHGEGDYNTFYGRNGGCEIHFVVNNNPDVKKVFTGMRQKSNAKFITLPFGIEAHDGEETMYSELRDAHIERLEGDYWADILRDMTDKEFANIEDIDLRDVTSLLKGRVMRGDYAVVKLRNTENKLISLYSVEVFSYSSHKTME